MDDINRRSALALGMTAGSLLLVGMPQTASAAEGEMAAESGEALPPGVTMQVLFEGSTTLPGYNKIRLEDYTFQPGSGFPEGSMSNAMFCHIVEGELQVVLDGKEFTAKQNDVFTCNVGTKEKDTNVSDKAALMRILHLMAS